LFFQESINPCINQTLPLPPTEFYPHFVVVFHSDARLKYGDYTQNLDRLDVYIESRHPGDDGNNYVNDNKKARLHLRDGGRQLCGSITRLNRALFKPVLHLQCRRAVRGRFVYIEAHGVANRWTRLFSAVLCEVMVYE